MKSSPVFNRLGIIGLGLLGGSLALVAREKNIVGEVIAYSRTPSTLAYALEQGIIDKAAETLADVVSECDFIIICTPLGAYRATIENMLPFLKQGVVISDVGSVKRCGIDSVLSVLPEEYQPFFIPAHPIAGSEKSGIKASQPELYEGRDVVITPLPLSNQEALDKVKQFWERIGSKVIELDADEHDQIYAQVSHTVQACAYAYMNHFRFRGKFSDLSFKRFCRLAGSDPRMWRDIFNCNTAHIRTSIDHLVQRLQHYVEHITLLASDNHVEGKDGFIDKLNVLFDKRDRFDPFGLIATVNVTLDSTRHIVPCMIGMALIEECTHLDRVGSGFKDVTSSVSLWPSMGATMLKQHADEVVESLQGFIEELHKMVGMMNPEFSSALEQYCLNSVLRYHSMFG
ncbi:MAG: prephenate dehydrogenase/arogenate dehydrogenase family protein [Alphaproteobacteria bacterium]|nr:prephenate dehydrogenase/arogenate dehydrogenase family protein [Alphaproteobacteria bacterium]